MVYSLSSPFYLSCSKYSPPLQDEIPEVDESFWVNLTSVQLIGATPSAGAAPSIRNPGNIAVVTIFENDDAQGIVQFNVPRVRYLFWEEQLMEGVH